MKTSKPIRITTLGLLSFAVLAQSGFSATAAQHEHHRAEKPAASPGWIVIEDDFYYPFQYEPLTWFGKAETSHIKGDEKTAAAELRKAESFLVLASNNALPQSKLALEEAATDIGGIASFFESGKTVVPAMMKAKMAKASKALADWHYFRAQKNISDHLEKDAVRDIQAASRYLKHAADSAEYKYGDKFVTIHDDLFGWTETDEIPNNLTEDLETVKSELDGMTTALEKADK